MSSATLAEDRQTVVLQIAGLSATMGLEVTVDLETATGDVLRAKIHGTLHQTK